MLVFEAGFYARAGVSPVSAADTRLTPVTWHCQAAAQAEQMACSFAALAG